MGIKIIIRNHKSRIEGHLKHRILFSDALKIRAKGYFFSPAYRKRQWDGYVRYLSETTGIFPTGILDQVINVAESNGIKYKLVDERVLFKNIRVSKEVGDKVLMSHQTSGLSAFLNNTINGLKFQRGIMAHATNSGKSVITAGVFSSFSKKRRGLLLVNNVTLFNQTLKDLTELFPDEVGQVSSKTTDWKRLNVCMVQTLGNRLKKDPKYRQELSKIDMIVVDEADEVINRKDCKLILAHCMNAPIRLAMTGTALNNKGTASGKKLAHGGSTRNQDQLAFFGPIIHRVTNEELVKSGVSTKPIIKFYSGNTHVKVNGDYAEEYLKGIVINGKRHRKIWKIVQKQIDLEKMPILIFFKIHKHGNSLLRKIPKEIRDIYNIEMVHHKTANKEKILDQFNLGKIDILLASHIIKRGKNLPLIKTAINAAGGDSHTVLLQVLGRALRKHKSKKTVTVIDLFDEGAYLKRHSKHRMKYYKNEKFEVIDMTSK